MNTNIVLKRMNMIICSFLHRNSVGSELTTATASATRIIALNERINIDYRIDD